MTINEARKILGKLGKNMSDAEVLIEVETASLLKGLFFRIYADELRKKRNLNNILFKNI